MRWLKRSLWKAGIAVTYILLLLVLMVWLPVSAAGADKKTSGLATPVMATVQATPTIDATVSTLSKEKLKLDIDKDRSDLFWAWTSSGVIVVGIVGVIFTFFQFLGKQLAERYEREKRREEERIEREKRDEERFQAAVTGLGDEKTETRIGAAILLRTFLRPGYEQFYTQAFDLAVANLRLPRTFYMPEDSASPLPLTTLSQALIVVFKEAFPLARNQNRGNLRSLDATGIQLDNAYLSQADLGEVWMPMASLRQVNLRDADLRNANLRDANLMGTLLSGADLSGANLRNANLRDANLMGTLLSGADLREADFERADLTGAALAYANLSDATLLGANLTDARSLESTKLHGIKGLTKEQLEACKAKGAIIDEDPTPSSSQSTTSPSPLSPSNDAQTPLALSAQVDIPNPDADSSNTASS